MNYVYGIIIGVMVLSIMKSMKQGRNLASIDVKFKMKGTLRSQLIYYFLFVIIGLSIILFIGQFIDAGTVTLSNGLMIIFFVVMGYSQFYSMPKNFYIYLDGIAITGYMDLVSRTVTWNELQSGTLDSKGVLKLSAKSQKINTVLKCQISPDDEELIKHLSKRVDIERI